MTYKREAAALTALGDATRRDILDLLRNGPRPVGELAKNVAVSRPAVSQHLKVLKDAELVTERAEGTRRIYRIDPRGLAAVRAWLDGFWADALQSFKAYSDTQESDP